MCQGHRCHHTEDSGGKAMFAVCKQITSLGIQTRLQRTAEETKTTEEVESPDDERYWAASQRTARVTMAYAFKSRK